MIKAGSLDRQITIQSKGVTYDGAGSEIVTWSDVATVWAGVTQKAGTERVEADQLTASEHTIFTIRYRTDVTPINRIVYETNTYDIKRVFEINRREGLEILAEYKDNK